MAEDESFAQLMTRVRAGDEQAAAELVRLYEPEIRREVRLRLSDPQVRRVFDSMDICQSVLASFFVRAALGQYDVNDPRQLLGLLLAMARNKLAFQVRKERAQRRDSRRMSPFSPENLNLAADGSSPSQVIAARELVEAFRSRLSSEERQMAEMRGLGREWREIAEQMGGTAEGRRKQLARAIARVSAELGLDEGTEE